MYKHQQGENTVLLKVDNVSLYEDIYGKIFSESSVLPTAVAINRIYWFNSSVSAASYSREDLMNYISDCELVLILPGDEEVVVASMVDRSDAGISLGKNHSDILPFIKDKYSTLFFRFTLKEIPPTGIDVFYDMIVNYEYDIEKERE